MNMIHYPSKGLQIGDSVIDWGTPREKVRQALGPGFKEENSVTSFKEFLPDSEDIIVRKDYYQNFQKSSTWFTFSYTEDDLLEECEIHQTEFEVKVKNIVISFHKDFFKVVEKLKVQNENLILLDSEDALLEDYKTSFSSQEHNGGDGQNIGYIYFSTNIEHLTKNL